VSWSAAQALRAHETACIRSAVSHAVEGVFATVEDVHAAVLRSLAGAGPTRRPVLEQDVAAVLHEPDQLAVGLGLVVAPRPENDLPLRLEWWQVDPEGGRLRALEPDLRPASLGYYDYTATEWFDVPRRTGRRHVVGPYVDVHGTGRYLLTLTQPVVLDGDFLGVVGADVSVGRFETRVLRILGPLEHPLVVLTDQGRVVLSTSPRWLVGDLVTTSGALPGAGSPLPGVPWRLHLLPRSEGHGRP
jgi:hypothetical protein